MLDDELSFDELKQVNTNNYSLLNELLKAYEHSNYPKVIDLGTYLLGNPAFSAAQKEEISRMIESSKSAINLKDGNSFRM